MKFTVITLFPNVIKEYINTSIISKALEANLIEINIIDLRIFGEGNRKNVDDTVYGGGNGMIITVPVIDKALSSIDDILFSNTKIVYMSPKGKILNQNICKTYSKDIQHLVIICGHYEGIDQRIFDLYNVEELSIGDYILTGGEIPAMTVIDSITRLIPGVIKEESHKNESFENLLLEEPQYTKPMEYKNLKVPEILLSGNHRLIEEYRLEEKIYTTITKRPDLFNRYLKHNNLDQQEIEKINTIIVKKEGNKNGYN